MITFEVVPKAFPQYDPLIRLPIRFMMALPAYVTADSDAPIFNLTITISNVLQRTDWATATGIFQPLYWSPDWTNPFQHLFPIDERTMQIANLPSLMLSEDLDGREYEIVYFTAAVGQYQFAESQPALAVDTGLVMLAPALSTFLTRVKTRLFILQVLAETSLEAAKVLAATLVNQGVPAVLVVFGDRININQGFTEFLYGISHNLPLTEVVRNAFNSSAVNAHFVSGTNIETLFQLYEFQTALRGQLGTISARAEQLLTDLGLNIQAAREAGDDISPSTAQYFESVAMRLTNLEEESTRSLALMAAIPPRWDHESDGIIPLAGISASAQQFETNLEEIRGIVDEIKQAPNPSLLEGAASNEFDGATSNAIEEAASDDRGWLGAPEPPDDDEAEDVTRGFDWGDEPANFDYEVEGAAPDESLPDDTIRDGEIPTETPETRQLNANFADSSGRVGGNQEALAPAAEYDLQVLVGPRREDSAVIDSQNAVWIEAALPVRAEYLIDVVFVSDDFTPGYVSAQMSVPRSRGQSSPVINGQKAEQPGWVKLRVQTPPRPNAGEPSWQAYGRLCLYYENNLVQSALVRYTISVEPGLSLDEENRNRIDVDYALTNTFAGFEDLATRTLRFNEQAEPSQYPLRMNLAMNSNGNGENRFIVKGNAALTDQPACSLAGHIPYDVLAGVDILKTARDKLFDCYYERDKDDKVVTIPGNDGKPTEKLGLDDNNGKDREQFKKDLRVMAAAGSDLFTLAFDQVKPEGACLGSKWRQNLRAALAETSLIQVSHAGLANYVFPWGLVYEYPLIGAERDEPITDTYDHGWRICPIVDKEWKADGTRAAPPAEYKQCPYHNEIWHRKNIICPYGFWGLKHMIEEPLSLKIAEDGAALGREVVLDFEDRFDLAIAITQDDKLKTSVDAHLAKLKAIPGVRFAQEQPAVAWADVRTMLKAPEIVYFLCHGESDDPQLLKDAYLSIGPRPGKRMHQIYATADLSPWMDDEMGGPDREAWSRRRPLVFINGCHTSDLKPGAIISFASVFIQHGASGVLGTEISVLISVAQEMAELFFKALVVPKPASIGDILREMRWALVNKGSLLGLSYTLYGLSDLRMTSTI